MFILPSVPLDPEIRSLSYKERIRELDLLGATVGITAMILFNFAWNQAPGFGWEQPYIYAMLIVGILLFPVFFWIEIKVSEKPLIPLDALSTDVSFVLTCIMCGWAAFGIWVYYYFQFLQRLRGESPLLTIAHTCPVAISGFIAAITTGHVISRIGPGWVMLISMLAFLTGNILVATMPIQQIYWAQAFVTTLVIPWGMDMSFPAATLIMSNAVAKRHQGMAASLVNTVVNYSISIGVATTIALNVTPPASPWSCDMMASSNPPIYQLPDELLIHVASYLPDSTAPTHLRNLSLVSRKLRPAAQETLHGTVKLIVSCGCHPKVNAVLKLLRTLLDRPDLALKVKTLRMRTVRKNIAKLCDDQGFDLEPLRTRSLARLGELGYTKSHPWYRTVQNSIESGFAGVLMTLVPTLTHLDFWVKDHHRGPPSGECVSGLFGGLGLPDIIVKTWANLQHLTTSDTHVLKCNVQLDNLKSLDLKTVSIGTVLRLNGPGCLHGAENLEDLAMSVSMGFADRILMDTTEIELSSLFEALSCNHLRSLKLVLVNDGYHEGLHALDPGLGLDVGYFVDQIDSVKHSLESLTIMLETADDDVALEFSVDNMISPKLSMRHFTALKHLVVLQAFICDFNNDDDWADNSCMPDELPQNLETLEIIYPTPLIEEWAKCLRSEDEEILPNLRELTLTCSEGVGMPAQVFEDETQDTTWSDLSEEGIETYVFCQTRQVRHNVKDLFSRRHSSEDDDTDEDMPDLSNSVD
ncbi:MelB, Na+melibiose symporter transporter [Pyrenophora tritici-repentis]|nr:MelB, Na+melibiose symporter transporter [Pyrenophora tritici-repentis]